MSYLAKKHEKIEYKHWDKYGLTHVYPNVKVDMESTGLSVGGLFDYLYEGSLWELRDYTFSENSKRDFKDIQREDLCRSFFEELNTPEGLKVDHNLFSQVFSYFVTRMFTLEPIELDVSVTPDVSLLFTVVFRGNRKVTTEIFFEELSFDDVRNQEATLIIEKDGKTLSAFQTVEWVIERITEEVSPNWELYDFKSLNIDDYYQKTA